MTTLRLVSPSDTKAVYELWQYCFADEEDFAQWYFKDYYQPENTLGVYEGERLLAATQITTYTIRLREKNVKAGYVVGVSTSPDARRQGLGQEMLTGALRLMRARGQFVSLLMPFEGAFYYRYHWQFAYFKQRLSLPVSELRGLAKPYGQWRLVEAREYLPELAAIYAAFCQGRNGYVLRTSADWERLLMDVALGKGFCCMLYHEGVPEGYVFYTMHGEDIQVIEMAYSHYQARGGLLDYFYGHRSHRKNFSWAAPADDMLAYELPKSKDVLTLYPYLMLRVVDAEQALLQLDYPKARPLTIRLKLIDDLASWNNGIFTLSVTDGRGQLTRQADDSPWDIQMDVGTLSLCLSGGADCRQLIWRGDILARDDALLEKWCALWPKQNNWINEDY